MTFNTGYRNYENKGSNLWKIRVSFEANEKENRKNRGSCCSHRSRSRRDRVQNQTLGGNPLIKSMGEMLAAGWSDGMNILEEVSRELAERLVNNRQPFVLVHVEGDGEVSFEGITEYDASELILNLSDRYGTLTEEMKDMGIDDVFYHDDFANDGGLVYLEEGTGLTLYEQIDNEVNLSAFHCYLCSGKNMGDVSKLPAGSYLMIDCGETMRKVRGQLKEERRKSTIQNTDKMKQL